MKENLENVRKEKNLIQEELKHIQQTQQEVNLKQQNMQHEISQKLHHVNANANITNQRIILKENMLALKTA